MTLFEAIIIAAVEGLTEFLPVSSTGHMIVTQHLLGVESTSFVKAFTIIIQFGAILSVIFLYWPRFFRLSPKKPELSGLSQFLWRFDFYWKLFIAFIPAAVFGLLLSDVIDELLENVWVVAVMLIVGGIFMIFADKLFHRKEEETTKNITQKQAFSIGLSQCIAMIPGVSRSMATIVGGMAQGLSRKDAAEFSFFLAVPTMFAAMAYKVLKLILEPGGVEVLQENVVTLIVGNVVALLVALLAIKFFIGFVSRYGFKLFGYYRIVAGGIILLMLMLGQEITL